jgi:hypothetical protein
MALKKRERKPDNIQNSEQMTLSTKFNIKFATLQKYSSKKTTRNIAVIQEDQRRKKIEEKNNSTSLHQTTFRNSLKGKIQYQENIKSSLTTYQFTSKIKCQNVFIERRPNVTTMFFKETHNNMT